ncbi:hypothetical protein FGB62_5g032 [Gracilaria domingensis]|nr:hypothetical protein FGB62_5g032 [Gracilaria domingensis]
MLSGRSLLAGLFVTWGTWSVAAAAVFPQAVPPVSGTRGRGDVLGPVVREGVMDEAIAMSAGMFEEEIEGMEELMASPSPEMMEMERATPEAELLDKAGEGMYEEMYEEMMASPTMMVEEMGPSPSEEYYDMEEVSPSPTEEDGMMMFTPSAEPEAF